MATVWGVVRRRKGPPGEEWPFVILSCLNCSMGECAMEAAILSRADAGGAFDVGAGVHEGLFVGLTVDSRDGSTVPGGWLPDS